jgi:hypothetical protein
LPSRPGNLQRCNRPKRIVDRARRRPRERARPSPRRIRNPRTHFLRKISNSNQVGRNKRSPIRNDQCVIETARRSAVGAAHLSYCEELRRSTIQAPRVCHIHSRSTTPDRLTPPSKPKSRGHPHASRRAKINPHPSKPSAQSPAPAIPARAPPTPPDAASRTLLPTNYSLP